MFFLVFSKKEGKRLHTLIGRLASQIYHDLRVFEQSQVFRTLYWKKRGGKCFFSFFLCTLITTITLCKSQTSSLANV